MLPQELGGVTKHFEMIHTESQERQTYHDILQAVFWGKMAAKLTKMPWDMEHDNKCSVDLRTQG